MITNSYTIIRLNDSYRIGDRYVEDEHKGSNLDHHKKKMQKKKKTTVAGLTFSNADDMTCLIDACYWVSVKIVESAKKGEKRSKSALEHNRKRVMDQMKKMDLVINDQ